jgi:tetratricopeptide (TPR) repeat protein
MTNENADLHQAGDEAHLAPLNGRFLQAMTYRRNGHVDRAADSLRAILKIEPRLAEPHMELASIHLSLEQPERAVEHAREAVRLLEAGSRWNEDLPANVVLSLAHDLLGESIRRIADQDSVVFGDPDRWRELMAEAKAAFKTSANLDPENEHASWSAFGFAPESDVLQEDPDAPVDVPPLDLVGLVALHEGVETT